MKKIVLLSLALTLLVFTSASAIVLFTGTLSHFTTTVNPPDITFVVIESSIPSLNSLCTFTTETYDPTGTEMSITNINLTSAYIYATDLSIVERNAFTNLTCHITIYNSTYTLLNSSFAPLLDQRLYISQPLAGDWDVTLHYSGATAIPETPVPVSFNIVINLTQDTPICLQWFGAANKTNATHWYPLENTVINVSNQECITDSRGYCTLNLSDHALYTATGEHPSHTATVTRKFIACGDGINHTGYPEILRF